jgi:hypothetical protein
VFCEHCYCRGSFLSAKTCRREKCGGVDVCLYARVTCVMVDEACQLHVPAAVHSGKETRIHIGWDLGWPTRLGCGYEDRNLCIGRGPNPVVRSLDYVLH